ncbi:MAG: hypothetical protein FWF22_01255 [Treponema sp.]|nr:hypothetical protein [Treponema sp.]
MLYPQETAEVPQTMQNSGYALNRLIGISDQLSALNERLRIELQDSIQNSRELQNMLEASKQELDGLKVELETLRISSAELLSRAESSQSESKELMTDLKKAESSLQSLDLSFGNYRTTAEQKITSLENENKFWKIGLFAAGIIAAGFGVAFVLAR